MKIAFFLLASLPVLVLSMLSNIKLKLSEYLKSDKPNIIFIVMDDLGYSQIGWTARHISQNDYDPLFLNFALFTNDYAPEHGLEFARRSTPTLSRMANNGAIFTNAFVSSNLCSPSRLGMATGIFQNRWGVYKNPDSEAHGLKPNSHLAERLKEIGYATAHVGKWHIGPRDNTMIPEFMKKHGIQASDGNYPPLARHPEVKKDMDANGYMGSTASEHHALNNGFDYYYGYNQWESPFYNADNVWDGFDHASPSPVYNTDLFTDKAIEFIEKSVKQRKPFYVQLHYHAVHGPLDPKAPDNYYDEFDSESFILNNFYAHVFAVDENVRRLEELLREKRLAENTIIVFTSDNGGPIGRNSPIPGNAPYRGQKGTYFLGGIRVPMLFYWPGEINKPFISDNLVSVLDILPTFIDAAGGILPDGLDGESLLPMLKGISDEPVHDYLIWSGVHAREWGFMVRTAFPAFTSRSAERREAPWAWGVVKDGYILRYVSETPPDLYKEIPKGRPAHIELYNYKKDPGEKNNIYEQEIQIANELQGIWEKEAVSFPPTVRWRRDRWEAIIPAENIYLKD